MTRVIRIDQEVEEELKVRAIAYGLVFGTPNEVLRKMLGITATTRAPKEVGMKETGRRLAEKWGVSVKHALYRETGDWYRHLAAFPGALFDSHGYIVFPTAKAYEDAPRLVHNQELSVKGGISSMPGYVRVK